MLIYLQSQVNKLPIQTTDQTALVTPVALVAKATITAASRLMFNVSNENLSYVSEKIL